LKMPTNPNLEVLQLWQGRIDVGLLIFI